MRYNSQGNDSNNVGPINEGDGSYNSKSRASQLSRVTQQAQNPFILDGNVNSIYPYNGPIKSGTISINH